ncbi:MAG: transcriptional regulator NrdR [Proteobacteria bacterium]|jgi:transcriptional repressor NrdR|nr:transcriptional regulator NrdR [Pseudomonadota bacterium]
MKCPTCGEADTRVIDSRALRDGSEIRRRRQCDGCNARFTTYERAEGTFPLVVKKDGRREPWSREKLLHGLAKACEKRPVPIEVIERVVDEIGRAVTGLGEAEIRSERIGEEVMRRLRKLDEVAYVRFASVYRSFKDIDEFMIELSTLMKKRESGTKEGEP